MIEPQSMQLGASAWVWKLTLVPPRLRVIGAVEPPLLPFVVLPLPLAAWPLPSEPLVAMTARGSAAGTAGSAATAVALGVSDSVVLVRSGAETAGAGSGSAVEELAEPVVPPVKANGVAAGASSPETRSWRPRLALSSGDRKREPSQRKM